MVYDFDPLYNKRWSFVGYVLNTVDVEKLGRKNVCLVVLLDF